MFPSTHRIAIVLFSLFWLPENTQAQLLLQRDILLCQGESLTVNGVLVQGADTLTYTAPGLSGQQDTLFTICIRQLPQAVSDCDCHPASFLKTTGAPEQVETATAITLSADGNLFIAGRKGSRTYLQKTNAHGEILWTRDFLLSAFEPVSPTAIFEDHQGFLVGCGIQGFVASQRKGFVFKYNPNTNQVVWSRSITSNSPSSAGILEDGPDGNYLFYLSPDPSSGNKDIEILELNRYTGFFVPDIYKRLEYKGADGISKLVRTNTHFYGTGTSATSTGVNNANRRPLLFKLKANLATPEWAQTGPLDSSHVADFHGKDLLLDDNTVLSLFEGTTAQNQVSLSDACYLQKTTTDGQVLWIKKYPTPGKAHLLVNTPDGYLIYGQTTANRHFLIKTAKNGAVQWARSLEIGPDTGMMPGAAGNAQAVFTGDAFILSGITTTGQGDAFLLKISAEGALHSPCANLSNLNLTAETLQAHTQTPVNLIEKSSIASGVSANMNPTETSLPGNLTCPDCQNITPCPENRDLQLELIAASCTTGKVKLELKICDLQQNALPDEIYVSFFDGNPLTQPANNIDNRLFTIPNSQPCTTLTIHDLADEFGPDAAKDGANLWAVINYDGVLGTPFSFQSFPVTTIAECNYHNNIASTQVQLPTLPTLSLGPDRNLCFGLSTILSANHPYHQYKWSTGSNNSTITVALGNQYRLTVTDACGRAQADTVKVTVHPYPMLSRAASICPGTTTTLLGKIYSHAGLYHDTIPALNGIGCDTIVTISITQKPFKTKTEFRSICPGDPITINGITLNQSGIIRDTLPAISGCDTVVTYVISTKNLPLRFDTAYICPGSSVTIGGVTYLGPGIAIDTIASQQANACDTIRRTLIIENQQFKKDSTHFLCPGDSLYFGGQYYQAPDTLYATLPGNHSSCDTALTLRLNLEPPSPSTFSLLCPPNIVFDVPIGTTSAMLAYNLPVPVSNCPCDNTQSMLLSGLPPHSVFPVGTTQVCYQATDYCQSVSSCCFSVKVQAVQPCDIKTIGCLKYELLTISADSLGQYTYKFRVTNQCTPQLLFTAIQLPQGVVAMSPYSNTIYHSPEGKKYQVRNPNYVPFYSIRFKSVDDSLYGGNSATLAFTLPQQIRPNYFSISSLLTNNTFHEAKLNTFNCPVSSHQQAADRQPADDPMRPATPSIYPNPSMGTCLLDLSAYQNQSIQLSILDALGNTYTRVSLIATPDPYPINLGTIAAGVYLVHIAPESDPPTTLRLLVAH
jgi:hypothetical protein